MLSFLIKGYKVTKKILAMVKTILLRLSLIIMILISFISILFAGYYNEGCKYYISKKYDLAKEMFLKSIEISDYGNAFYFLGEIAKNEGNFDKAEEYFIISTTKKISKKYLKLSYWNLIVLKEQKGEYDVMIKFCKELWLKLNENGAMRKVETLINKFLWTNNQNAKDSYQRGLDLKFANKIEESINSFYEALHIDSSFLAPKFEIALILYQENRFNEAIQYLNEIVNSIPFYAEVHLLLAEIYFNKKLYQHSIYHFDNATKFGFLDKKTQYLIRLRRGTSYYNLGYYEKAEKDIIKVLETNPKNIESLFLLSAINIKRKNYAEALQNLKIANSIKPDDTEIIFQMGSIYYKAKDTKYISFFERLLEKVKSKEKPIPLKYFKALQILAKNHFENGKYSEILEIIEILPEEFREYEINLISAKSYFYAEIYDKAIDFYEKLYLSNDDKYMLCVAYAKNGMEKKARDILWELSLYESYLEKAKREQVLILNTIALEINNEKARREEKEKEEEIKKQTIINESNIGTEEKIKKEKNQEEIKKERIKVVEEYEGMAEATKEIIENKKNEVENKEVSMEKNNKTEIEEIEK